jgi:hypothetical protein
MCKSISKSLAKLFCKGKYIKFVKKILSNRIFIFLSIYSRSLFWIRGLLSLASRASSHPHGCSP